MATLIQADYADAGKYYRKLQIEPGDNLSTVCWDWGVDDWEPVYALAINAPFAARYPDPDVIDYIDTSVFLYIPMPTADTAVQRKGRRLGNALRVLFKEKDGSSIAAATSANPKKELYIVDGPGTSTLVWIEATLTIPNVDAGVWTVSSARRRLDPATAMSASDRLIDVTNNPGAAITTVSPTVGTLLTSLTRKAYWIECPMCRKLYSLCEKKSGEEAATCPNDGYDLDDLTASVDWESDDWATAASTESMETISAADVRSRGTYSLAIPDIGSVKVFWDETRFANWEAGDYILSKQDGSVTVSVVGRTTWGAASPIRTQPEDKWTFHVLLAADVPAEHDVYKGALPLLQNSQIHSFTWYMTVHHAADSYTKQASYDYPLANQSLHQTVENNADLGYHFLIDENGVIYEGRPVALKGSHAERFNSYNIGIQLSGQFEPFNPGFQNDPVVDSSPTSAQETAALNLVRVLKDRLPSKDIEPHYQRKIQAHLSSTYCPGLYAEGAVWRLRHAVE